MQSPNTDDTVALRGYLRGIVGNAPFGIVTISNDLEVGIINRLAADFLSINATELQTICDSKFDDVFINVPQLVARIRGSLSKHQDIAEDLSDVVVAKRHLNITARSMLHGTLFIIQDITEQYQLENRLRYEATHDSLTGLINRSEFELLASRAFEKASKYRISGAFIFIDLDRFKPINDSEGHACGDELLKIITDLICSTARSTDTIARLGGDEFVAMLEDCSMTKAFEIAEKMRLKVQDYVHICNDTAYHVSLSGGIAAFGRVGETWAKVLNAADNACQIAKQEGRNRIHVADADNREYQIHKKEVAWLPKIRKAIDDNEFELHVQPIVPTQTGSTHLSPLNEVLIRLRASDGKLIPPSAFIPPAERYDLMSSIDTWVVEQTFRHAHVKHQYTINLSGQTVKEKDFADQIVHIAEQYKVSPHQFVFEVTETAAIQNIESSAQQINQLRALGFRFALDDFGSGLASFSYLQNLPFDLLKIDGAFVLKAAQSEQSFAMLKAISELGKALGLEIIAEHIENEAIWNMICKLNIDYGQGFYLGKPAPLAHMISPQDTNSKIVPITR